MKREGGELHGRAGSSLLDGELANLTASALCFVDTAIRSTANEADDLIPFIYPLLASVAGQHGCFRGVGRIWGAMRGQSASAQRGISSNEGTKGDGDAARRLTANMKVTIHGGHSHRMERLAAGGGCWNLPAPKLAKSGGDGSNPHLRRKGKVDTRSAVFASRRVAGLEMRECLSGRGIGFRRADKTRLITLDGTYR